MDDERLHKLIDANRLAMKRVAALLESVASLIDLARPDTNSIPREIEPLAPTRRMPAMEQHALALDDAVQGVARAIERLEPQDSTRRRALGQSPGEHPDATTRKLSRPEQMIELIERNPDPPSLPPGSIVEVEPVSKPESKRRTQVGAPQSFGRSHPKR